MSWSAGSMAVPHTYSWEFTWDDSSAHFALDSLTSDDSVLYETTATPTADQIRTLCTQLAEIDQEDDQGIGGAYLHWETTSSTGRTTIEDNITAPARTMIDIIGQEHYDNALDAWKTWRDTYEGP